MLRRIPHLGYAQYCCIWERLRLACITHAMACFLPQTRDHNRGGAPRLDFCFYRMDGSMCRCQADLSLTSTHYQSDAFQLARCALSSATLFSSLSRKGSNVAQLAVAIAHALGGVLQLAVSQTHQRCSAWCFFELVLSLIHI